MTEGSGGREVCFLSVQSMGRWRIFVNDPTNAKIKKVEDPTISSDWVLGKKNGKVVFTSGGSLHSLTMK